MYFSLDYKTQKWKVIDGLQRIATIIDFLSGSMELLSKLDDIDPKISGKKISNFIDENSELHHFYQRIENLTLPITVLRCDYSKATHTEYLFTIFHRLNTGGMKLNNQEIRNCIYSGSLNKLLHELNSYTPWMKLNRMKQEIGYRFTKQELILRLFAFNDNYKSYGGRLAKFLNEYMNKNKELDDEILEQKRLLFERTVNVVYKKIFMGTIPKKLTMTVLETLLVGVSCNLDYLESQTNSRVKNLYERLVKHEELSEEKLKEGLSGKDRVIGRIEAAIKVFSGN